MLTMFLGSKVTPYVRQDVKERRPRDPKRNAYARHFQKVPTFLEIMSNVSKDSVIKPGLQTYFLYC